MPNEKTQNGNDEVKQGWGDWLVSFVTSKERNSLNKMADRVLAKLKMTGEAQAMWDAAEDAFDEMLAALRDYLAMKHKELAGVRKRDNEQEAQKRLDKYNEDHEKDKSGWGYIITKGTKELRNAMNLNWGVSPGWQLPKGGQMRVRALLLILQSDTIVSGLPKKKLSKALCALLSVYVWFQLSDYLLAENTRAQGELKDSDINKVKPKLLKNIYTRLEKLIQKVNARTIVGKVLAKTVSIFEDAPNIIEKVINKFDAEEWRKKRETKA